MSKPSAITIDVWIRLSRAHQTVLSSIEKSLKDAGMPPLSWYDVLLELDRVGNQGTRAYVLQNKLLLPQYGLSRVLNRIEKAGYLERHSVAEDGRGQRLIITPSGRRVRKKIWAVYGRAMEQAIGCKLTQEDGKRLSQFLKRLM